MAFTRFEFTKSWTDPSAFPTVESDEVQVRADMQSLHDEGKEGLNGLMEQLEKAAAADSLGAQAVDGSGGSTLQKELNALYKYLTDKLGSVSGVVTRLGGDHTTIPTSKAVSDALTQSGSLPAGGEAGQVLMKESSGSYDMFWGSVTPEGIGALRVAAGSYDGTDTYGSGKPNTLTFDFEPYLVLLRSNGYGFPVVCVRGSNARHVLPRRNVLGECLLRMNWGTNSLSWYAENYQYYDSYGDSDFVQGAVDAAMQLNVSYLNYKWIAIGK